MKIKSKKITPRKKKKKTLKQRSAAEISWKNKHLGCSSCKILRVILKMVRVRIQTKRPKDQEINDLQDFTPKR